MTRCNPDGSPLRPDKINQNLMAIIAHAEVVWDDWLEHSRVSLVRWIYPRRMDQYRAPFNQFSVFKRETLDGFRVYAKSSWNLCKVRLFKNVRGRFRPWKGVQNRPGNSLAFRGLRKLDSALNGPRSCDHFRDNSCPILSGVLLAVMAANPTTESF